MPESSTLAQMVGFRRDGTEVPVEVALNPIRIQNQPFVGVTLTDLSERLRVENEAALQRQELAHLSRVTLLGEMSGSLAHELNQPLTAILSNAQAGLRFLDHVPPALGDVRDCLAHVVENDKRAGEVIRRLRALLRKDHVNFQTLDLNEMVHDVMKIVASDLINRNVKPRLELAPSLPLIQGDRVQLQQVLLNLVMNGCDAMDALDVMSSQRVIKLCTRCVGQQEIEVMVSDNGSGIPEEDLERIFVPFMTTKPHGLGFGLAICRTIINEHQGKLWASKRPQHGSTLHFLLPASQKA